MNLLGLELQKAGISFLFAQANHGAFASGRPRRTGVIVCRTEEDAARAQTWAATEALALPEDLGWHLIIVRVATPEEIAEYGTLGESS